MFKSKIKRESDQFLINKKLMEKLITKRNMLIERAIENLSNEKIKLSSISVVGGVANNNYIKSKLLNITNKPMKTMI